MKKLLTLLLILSAFAVKAQKIDSIYFNLYTDSLKKGVHNYINVVAKMSDGSYYPLMADELQFTSSAGRWSGNNIIIDSAYKLDSVLVTAKLKNGSVSKSVVIYMKKNLNEGPLKTEKELLDEWKRPRKKSFAAN